MSRQVRDYRCDEPVHHPREPGFAGPEGAFSRDRAFAVDDAGLVDIRARADRRTNWAPIRKVPSTYRK